MGAITEINSIVRFPGDFDLSKLKHGLIVDLELERERGTAYENCFALFPYRLELPRLLSRLVHHSKRR